MQSSSVSSLDTRADDGGAPVTAHFAGAGGFTPIRAVPQPHVFYDQSQRFLDISIALVASVVALPVLGLGALAIVLTTGQNPFLVQRRIGRQGRDFPMLKLRTMRRGSGDEPSLPPPPGEVFVAKTPDDPRVTPVGRIMRRTSIDELPQLVNVIVGHMSLVGPRPALPEEVARYPHSWYRRLAVKPGLTGLWQVSGRSDVPPRRRIALDRAYIARRSLPLYAAILLRTLVATLSMRGAW